MVANPLGYEKLGVLKDESGMRIGMDQLRGGLPQERGLMRRWRAIEARNLTVLVSMSLSGMGRSDVTSPNSMVNGSSFRPSQA